jgi:predicted phage gp36 major capsid-like protein
MAAHFPNGAWLPVQRETLEALRRFKTGNALPTWNSTLTALLERAGTRSS